MTLSKSRNVALFVLWVAYLAGLYWFALRPDGPPGAFQPANNLIPLKSILNQLTTPTTSLFGKAYYLIGNLLLLAPLGALIAVTAGRRIGLLGCAAAALIMSTAIEVIQGAFLDGRAGDVDDIILNTLGSTVVSFIVLGFLRRSFSYFSSSKVNRSDPPRIDERA